LPALQSKDQRPRRARAEFDPEYNLEQRTRSNFGPRTQGAHSISKPDAQ
jgi:hypothetical protein